MSIMDVGVGSASDGHMPRNVLARHARTWLTACLLSGLCALAVPEVASAGVSTGPEGLHEQSGKSAPKIANVRLVPNRRGVRITVRVTYPAGFWETQAVKLTARVWGAKSKIGRAPLGVVRDRAATRTRKQIRKRHTLQIGGRAGRALRDALRRGGKPVFMTIVSHVARSWDADKSPEGLVSNARLVRVRGRTDFVGGARSAGNGWPARQITVINQTGSSAANARSIELDGSPLYCMFDYGQWDSNIAALRGTVLEPGQSFSFTARAADNLLAFAGSDIPFIEETNSLRMPILRGYVNAVRATNYADQSTFLPFGAYIHQFPSGLSPCANVGGKFVVGAQIDPKHFDPNLPDGMGLTSDFFMFTGDRGADEGTIVGDHFPSQPNIQFQRTGNPNTLGVTYRPADDLTAKCENFPASWMRCMAGKQKAGTKSWDDRPLSRVTLPATHDSGSANLSDQTHAVNIGPDKCGFGPGANASPFRAWSITQWAGLTYQLDHGVRYLDLRFAYNPAWLGWTFSHGALSQNTMRQDLDEVTRWLRQHPKESVVINASFCFAPDIDQRKSEQESRLLKQLVPGGFDDENSVCGLSVRRPDTTVGALRVKDVQGRLVLGYAAYGHDFSDTFKAAAAHCGFYEWNGKQVEDIWPDVSGPQDCSRNFDLNDILDKFREEGKRDKPFKTERFYAEANRLFIPQLIWSPNPVTSARHYTLNECPQTLLLYGFMLDRRGLIDALGPRLNVALMDGPPRELVQKLIGFNEEKVRNDQ